MTTPAERTEAATEPTQAQIEEARNFAEDFGLLHEGFIPGELAQLIAHIRREARNAALEKAAKVCEEEALPFLLAMYGGGAECHASVEECQIAIRALKDQP